MNRALFGTDGVRGLVGEYPLDDDGLVRIGRAIGTLFAKENQKIVIACDPRKSSEHLVKKISEGLVSVGVDVIQIGVLPTPGLAYITGAKEEFTAGVMVTASHNPVQYNGVKVFDSQGHKLSDETEAELNHLIETDVPERGKGKVEMSTELTSLYEDFLISTAAGLNISGMKVAVDSANGAASQISARVFKRLGANVTDLFASPDGSNINDHCGATDTTVLEKVVKEQDLDVGIALDGDGDRLIMVDHLGRIVRGDYLLYILAVVRQADGVVATIMSNQGLENALGKKGIKLLRVAVGDRYVLEALKETGYHLGGETSGHIIFPLVLSTGDGMLAAVQTLRAIATSGKKLAEWCDEVTMLPQAIINLELKDKSVLEDDRVKSYINEQAGKLNREERLLIRPSGTEPVVRIMVEAPGAEEKAQVVASGLSTVIQEVSGVMA